MILTLKTPEGVHFIEVLEVKITKYPAMVEFVTPVRTETITLETGIDEVYLDDVLRIDFRAYRAALDALAEEMKAREEHDSQTSIPTTNDLD